MIPVGTVKAKSGEILKKTLVGEAAAACAVRVESAGNEQLLVDPRHQKDARPLVPTLTGFDARARFPAEFRMSLE